MLTEGMLSAMCPEVSGYPKLPAVEGLHMQSWDVPKTWQIKLFVSDSIICKASYAKCC